VIRLGLRSQLLIPTCLLLAAPLLVFFWFDRYASQLEAIQQSALQTNMSTLQKSLLKEINFDDEILDIVDYERTQDLYAPRLSSGITLDGKSSDWPIMPIVRYGKTELINIDYPYTEDSLAFELKMGIWQKALFVFVSVKDDQVIYRQLNNLSIHRNDHVRILLFDNNGKAQRYTIAPFQPSKISAYFLSATGRALRSESKISGVWSATSEGYDLEFKIPINMLNKQFAISVADVDSEATRVIKYIMGSGNIDQVGSLQLPSEKLTLKLKEFAYGRMSILDSHHRLIAEWGSSDQNTDPLINMYRTQQGLALNPMVESQSIVTNSEQNTRLKQTVALTRQDREIGILQIEQSKLGLVLILAEAKSKLIFTTVLILALGLFAWFLTSSLIIRRIAKLSNAVEKAVDSQGRVSKLLAPTNDHDELGDLSQSFSNIVDRLHQYNVYLETMASRLAHELRTPVSVVRSSLENLILEDQTSENKIYLERANNGVHRLTRILNKMSEATRLEQSLDEDEIETFNLVNVIDGCVKGYRQAYPEFDFNLSVETDSLILAGIPDLIAQLLDKLVSNAYEFASPGSSIKIRMTQNKNEAILRVINDGLALPEEMQDKLFDSMISVRNSQIINNHSEKGGKETHLGLGLYIAKVITQFHGGSIKIANREDTLGVIVTVSIPLMRITSKL